MAVILQQLRMLHLLMAAAEVDKALPTPQAEHLLAAEQVELAVAPQPQDLKLPRVNGVAVEEAVLALPLMAEQVALVSV